MKHLLAIRNATDSQREHLEQNLKLGTVKELLEFQVAFDLGTNFLIYSLAKAVEALEEITSKVPYSSVEPDYLTKAKEDLEAIKKQLGLP